MFACHNLLVQEGGCYLDLWVSLKVRDAEKHPAVHRTAPLQRIIGTEVEKPCFRVQSGNRHCECQM